MSSLWGLREPFHASHSAQCLAHGKHACTTVTSLTPWPAGAVGGIFFWMKRTDGAAGHQIVPETLGWDPIDTWLHRAFPFPAAREGLESLCSEKENLEVFKCK